MPETVNKALVDELFNVGAHYGYSKSRRHPSVAPFIFGRKKNMEIIDLEKTSKQLEDAKAFVEQLAKDKKQLLFVGGKRQSQRFIKDGADLVDQPYVNGRWIGGALTNFEQIQKRTARLEDLTTQREKGELAKYTKKERLLIDREIERLEENFKGILPMKKKPGAIFIIDAKHELNALNEGLKENIPIISLCSSDCDISKIKFPIVGNDSSIAAIEYVIKQIVSAYEKGLKS